MSDRPPRPWPYRCHRAIAVAGLELTLAALWWLRRIGLAQAARAGLVCDFIGGIGFAAASMLKLVESGLIGAVGLACTLLVLAGPPHAHRTPAQSEDAGRPWLARTLQAGLLAAAGSILLDWAVVRAIYGDRFAGHASLHIRFGPRAAIHQGERR